MVDTSGGNNADELISAYLDGELGGEQLARVEQRIAQDVEYRRMLDELRALRDSIRSLPQYQLDPEFSQRVLRRAEREMLQTPSVELPPPDGMVTGGGGAAAKWADRGLWRGAVWAAAAVAAAVLLVLAVPNLSERRPVAVVDSTSPAADPPRMAEMTVDTDFGAEEGHESFGGAKVAGKAGPPEPSAENLPSQGNFSRAAKRAAGATGSKTLESSADVPRHQIAKLDAPLAADEEMPVPGAEPDRSVVADNSEASLEDSQELARNGWEPILASASPPVSPDVIVTINVRADALHAGIFDQSLARNSIQFGEELPENFNWVQREAQDEQKDLVAERLSSRAQAMRSDADAVQGELDLIYVEATQEQIDATLAELDARPDQFFDLVVDGSPANRRRGRRSRELKANKLRYLQRGEVDRAQTTQESQKKEAQLAAAPAEPPPDSKSADETPEADVADLVQDSASTARRQSSDRAEDRLQKGSEQIRKARSGKDYRNMRRGYARRLNVARSQYDKVFPEGLAESSVREQVPANAPEDGLPASDEEPVAEVPPLPSLTFRDPLEDPALGGLDEPEKKGNVAGNAGEDDESGLGDEKAKDGRDVNLVRVLFVLRMVPFDLDPAGATTFKARESDSEKASTPEAESATADEAPAAQE